MAGYTATSRPSRKMVSSLHKAGIGTLDATPTSSDLVRPADRCCFSQPDRKGRNHRKPTDLVVAAVTSGTPGGSSGRPTRQALPTGRTIRRCRLHPQSWGRPIGHLPEFSYQLRRRSCCYPSRKSGSTTANPTGKRQAICPSPLADSVWQLLPAGSWIRKNSDGLTG